MQEAGVDEHEAEPAEARWYLSRDGQQHGPLSDRELSLFAEGGNFLPGDLLWTAGLDEWKPADSIFGLAEDDSAEAGASDTAMAPDAGAADAALAPGAEAETQAPAQQRFEDESFFDDPLHDDPLGGDPLDDQVGALAKALRGEAEPAKLSFQQQLAADIKTFGGLCAYLWAVFIVLTVHAVVGGAQFGVGLSFFLLTTVNAFLLMRAMPLVERQGFFQNLKHKPLAYSIVCKTLIFVTALVLAYAVEMGVLGLVGIGAGFMSLGGGLGGMFAWWLIFSLALIPYFAFREVEAAVGADMMSKLMLGRL